MNTLIASYMGRGASGNSPVTLVDVCAILALPICTVLLGIGLHIIISNYLSKREERRKRQALRQKRVYLERIL